MPDTTDIQELIDKSTCGVCSDDFDNVYSFTKQQLSDLLEKIAKAQRLSIAYECFCKRTFSAELQKQVNSASLVTEHIAINDNYGQRNQTTAK